MSASTLSKEFFELIKAIGESKSKQEEDRIVQDEVKVLKSLLHDLKSSGGGKKMREILVRLIYVEMLGHDASWGYIVAVQQTATVNLYEQMILPPHTHQQKKRRPQKRAGYLACSLMLNPDHEFRFMLVNQMQRDLGSANMLESCASLVALCKLVTLEMIPALLPKVSELLQKSEHTLVRKKSVMALHRFYQMDPHSVSHLKPVVRMLLRDRDASVMASALCLLHEWAKEDAFAQLDLVDQYCSILKQITEHRLPREFDYHRMPAPWIQIKLLQVLATLGLGNKQASESMYEILSECIKRADSGTNAGFAVAYECVHTIATIYPCEWLLDLAASTISRFIQSEQYNLKFLGVMGLSLIVKQNAKYALQHQLAVIDCLEDPDESLKRITLELLYRMTTPVNVEPVVEKLAFYLHKAKDPFLKSDLVKRIVDLADSFAPSNEWFVSTVVMLMEEHQVPQSCLDTLLHLTEEEPEIRPLAVELLTGILRQHASHCSEPALQTCFWVCGEFVTEDQHEVGVLMATICRKRNVSDKSSAFALTAIGKLFKHEEGNVPVEVSQWMQTLHRKVELDQRVWEWKKIWALPAPVREDILRPVASENEEDPVDFSFLDEFCDILHAAGAMPYQPSLMIRTDSHYYDENDEEDLSGRVDVPPASTSLRFDAYEAPKIEYSAPPAVSSTMMFPGPPASLDMPPVPSLKPSLAAKPSNVKNLWGPSGYSGGGTTAVQQQQAYNQYHNAATPTPPPPTTSVYDFGGDAELDAEEDVKPSSRSQPKPLPVKELTEREKAAMALFSGTGTVKERRSNKPIAQAQAPPAAVPTIEEPPKELDLLSLDQDVVLTPQVKKQQGNEEALIDLFSSTGVSVKPPSLPTPPPPMDLFSMPLMTTTTPTPPVVQPPPSLMKPHSSMTTPEFGSLWGQCQAEVRFSLKNPLMTLESFLSLFSDRMGAKLVEFLPLTQEAIFAGTLDGQVVVLMHMKQSTTTTQLDMMVRTTNMAASHSVQRECERWFH